jgi:hypothetical protein
MADLFNFEEVSGEREQGTGGGTQKYIYPGIKHHVIIKNVKTGKSANETPFIEIEMYTKEGGPDTSRSFKFYTSEKAVKMSMEKIKHIATKVATADEVNAAKDLEALRDLLKGKALRMKFVGREYRNSNNELKEAAEIGLAPFAEAIEEGAEHAPVADEDTQLTFDKDNEYDMVRLKESPESAPKQSPGASSTPWSV